MRTLFPVLLAVLALVPAGVAAQQGGVDAMASPSPLESGDSMELILRIEEPELVEVTVQEHVTCTVTFPNGEERSPCDRTSALVEVRTSGEGAREYVFDYQAPSALGEYDLTMRAESTLRVFPQTYEASTTFRVVEAADGGTGSTGGDAGSTTDGGDGTNGGEEDPTGPGDEPTGGEGDGPGGDGDTGKEGNLGDAFPDVPKMVGSSLQSAETRALVSTTMAGGVISLALVATRWPLVR